MSHDSDRDSLLRDVLAEDSSSDARAQWLGESIRLLRRRRIQRRARTAIVTLAVVAVSALLTSRLASKRSIEARPASNSFTSISTRPLAQNALIATQPLDAAHFITSTVNASLVRTAPGQFRTINDSELLALVYPRAAILVRADRGSARLVFVNPE